MKELPSERIESERRQLWREIAVAVARSEAAKDPEAPANWANHALKAFDKKFATKPEEKP